MARVERKGRELHIVLGNDEASGLKIDESQEYSVKRINDSVFAVEKKGSSEKAAEAAVLGKINKEPLQKLVEGEFEKLLGREELKALQRLLKEGSVVKFKLSEKYKKAVYREKERAGEGEGRGKGEGKGQHAETQDRQGSAAAGNSEESEEPTLEKSGFVVVENEQQARKISSQYESAIKSNEIKGIRGFDRCFYIVQCNLYDKYSGKILKFLEKNNTAALNEISEALAIDKRLVKAICEFLREEGSIIEKRRGIYGFVGD